jgi:hypothetical protein
VPPLYIQLTQQKWPDGHRRALALLREHRRAGCRAKRSTRCAKKLARAAGPYLMYGPHRRRSVDVSCRRTRSIAGPIRSARRTPSPRILVLREDGTPCAPDEPASSSTAARSVAMGYWGIRKRRPSVLPALARDGKPGLVCPSSPCTPATRCAWTPKASSISSDGATR